MVSSEGLVRGIDRTLEYAEYRGRAADLDPDLRRRPGEDGRAQIVEGTSADIVDVNMGCPVPKIAKHNAGCSLMREPATRPPDQRDGQAVKIPVTVKMRATGTTGAGTRRRL